MWVVCAAETITPPTFLYPSDKGWQRRKTKLTGILHPLQEYYAGSIILTIVISVRDVTRIIGGTVMLVIMYTYKNGKNETLIVSLRTHFGDGKT